MARIKIKDLPKGMAVSKEEMRKVFGGALNPAFSYSSAFGDPACWSAIDDPLSSDTDTEEGSSGSSSYDPCAGINDDQYDQCTEIQNLLKRGNAVAGVRG